MQALTPDDAIVATYREHGHALVRGHPGGRGDGGDVRQGQRLQPRPRRLDAPLRRLAPLLRRLRHRRRRTADRRRPGAGRQAAGARNGSPPASSATAPSPRASSTSRSTWPRCGSCRCCSSARTTSTRWAPRSSGHQAQTDIRRKAEGYGDRRPRRSTAWTCWPSRRQRGARRRRCAASDGPFLLEARTYRFRAHSMYDPELYRTKAEVEQWKQRDPIDLFEARLRELGLFSDDGPGRDRSGRGRRDRRGGARSRRPGRGSRSRTC